MIRNITQNINFNNNTYVYFKNLCIYIIIKQENCFERKIAHSCTYPLTKHEYKCLLIVY